MTRIPSGARFLELSPLDRMRAIEVEGRQIESEIESFRSGHISLTNGQTRAYHLKLLRAQRQRLAKLADKVRLVDKVGLGNLM